MKTDTTRALHARGGLALPSDLTDAEWALLEPFFAGAECPSSLVDCGLVERALGYLPS